MSPLNFSSSPGLGSPAPTSTLSRFAVPASSPTGLTGSGLSRFEPGSIQQPPSAHFNINEAGLTMYQQARMDDENRIREEAIAGGALTMEDAMAMISSGEGIDDPSMFAHLGLAEETFFTPKQQRQASRQGRREGRRAARQERRNPARQPVWALAHGGLVSGPVVSYGLGGPVAAPGVGQSPLDSQLSPEQEQLLQGAIAALDPASKMSEDDRMLILREFEEEFGPGSVKILMEEIQGQQGAGGASDGLSDSVPAVVDGLQPAALSEGEFVVPSDAVSGIGNGSSKAGARELTGMVDRIRGARGNAGKPKKINAGNLLVA